MTAEPPPADAGQLIDSVRGYLSAPQCAVLSSLGPDGAPQQAVVHYLLGRDHLLVNGRPDRRWAANLRRDPRVSLVIHDGDKPLHWVGVRGVAQLRDESRGAVQDAMTMAQRYGEDPAEYEQLQRVSFEVVPHRVFEYGGASADRPASSGTPIRGR